MWISTVTAHALFRPALAATALIVLLAVVAASVDTAHAQQVDDSLPPLADLTIVSEYVRGFSVNWRVTVKNDTVGAHPGVQVNLVKVRFTISDPVRGDTTSLWTIRNLPPGGSVSGGSQSLRNIPAATDGPEWVAQRFYAEIIESDPVESPRFRFNNATEHWAIENRRGGSPPDGRTYFTNGDVAIDVPLISDRRPRQGGATTFTVVADGRNTGESNIPGLQGSNQDHRLLDVQVEISLSPGLSFAAKQPEAPSAFGATTFDTSTGIWNIGSIRSHRLSLPVAVNLTSDSLADLPLEERCLTAKVVSAVPWFANDPLKRQNDSATACLGKAVLLSSGTMDLIDFYPCISDTSTPCTSTGTLELVVGRRVGGHSVLLQPEVVIVHVPDPDGRTSKGGVIWSTVNLMDLKDTQTRLTSSWSIKEAVTVTAPGGGDAPGRWLLTNTDDSQSGNFDILNAPDSTKVTYEFFDLSDLGNDAEQYYIDVKVDFWALGTYEALYEIAGRLSGATYTATSTYTFHVGPMADLEVRDAGASPAAAAGQSAYTIMVVNNGPDAARDVRVTGLPTTGVTEYFASEGDYDPAIGVWTIGELVVSPVRRTYGMTPTLTLATTNTAPITVNIANTDYCVRIKDSDFAPENDLPCAGSLQTGYTEHTAKYYDYKPKNNTTTIEARAGTGAGAPSTTMVNIHGQIALLSWTPVKNLHGYPVTGYEVQKSERGANDWDPLDASDFFYADSGGGGGNMDYRVRAVNEFDVKGPWSQVVDTLPQMGRAGPPTGLSATADGTNVSLSWTRPTDIGDSAITGYVVEYSTDDGDNWLLATDSLASTTTSYTHATGRMGTRHCYRVAAVNANGVGDYSTGLACATTEAVPGAPADPRAAADGDTSIELNWTAPADDGGSVITGYDLERSTDNGVSWASLASGLASTTTTYTDTGLNAGSRYCYQVRAVNANGNGAFSVRVCATTEDVPGVPVNLRAAADGENDIDLTWNAPSNDGGSAITGYRIDHSTDDGGNWQTLVADTASAARRYDHASLSAGSRNCYRVAAINTHGEGPLSGQACATTEGAPDAPWNLRASPASETSIRLTWNAPSDDGGSAITGYLVQYYDGDAWQTLESNLATTTYEHTERDAGTNYCYRVAAINSNGAGPYSGQSCATTQGQPDAPESLSSEVVGKTRITLTWDAPTDTGGATITGYRIDYSTDGGNTWQTLEHSYYDYERRTYGHTGLTPGTSYCYRVAAVHDNGTGPFSNEVCATTEGATATDLPGEPENLRLTQVGSNYVTLKWDPPSLGGEVEYYEWRSNISDPVRVNGTTATVRGLSDRYTYDFHARAGNSLGKSEWAPATSLYAAPGGTTVTPRPLELKVKKGQAGSFNVKLGSSPKWPLVVSFSSWDGDVCLTDELIYQSYRYLLPGDPPPSKEFWNDHWWGTPGDRLAAPWNSGIDFRVDASRCHGGETAVIHLTVSTLPFSEISGESLWEDYELDPADWESKWGDPEVYQSGPSIKLSVVE